MLERSALIVRFVHAKKSRFRVADRQCKQHVPRIGDTNYHVPTKWCAEICGLAIRNIFYPSSATPLALLIPVLALRIIRSERFVPTSAFETWSSSHRVKDLFGVCIRPIRFFDRNSPSTFFPVSRLLIHAQISRVPFIRFRLVAPLRSRDSDHVALL